MGVKNRKEKAVEQQISFLDKIDNKKGLLITAGILVVLIAIMFKPFLFDGLYPGGEDVVGSLGKSKQIKTYQEQTGETALWNPAIFGGMPVYPRLVPKIINFDTLIQLVSGFAFWAFWYFFLGGLGVFWFLKQKNIPWYISLIMAVVFILLPDWQAQLGAGHAAKIRAIMVLPILAASFNYFFEKKSWLSSGLFALIFAWMVRTQHFQIIFYAILLLFFLYIVPFIKMWMGEQKKDAMNLSIKFVAAIVLTILTSASPFLTIKEYTPYSTRGGNAVVMDESLKGKDLSGGVPIDYATKWSLAPSEMLDFFVARFHGGYSGEVYQGKKYPQLKGRSIPGYWGEKPFNGNFSFIGILIIAFAIFGFVQNRKNGFVIATFAFVIFTLLLSFGRHFPLLYELFFYNFPYFSKFRAPSMITNVSFVGMIILASYGLKSIIDGIKEKDLKNIYYVFGSAIVLTVGLYLFKGSFDFTTAAETKYDANTLKTLKDIRLEFLSKDLLRTIFVLIAAAGFLFAFLKSKIKKEVFIIVTALLIGIEVYYVTDMSIDRISKHNRENLEARLFQPTKVTNYLSKQKKDARLIALNNNFGSNHYAYFYNTINGYSSIKLQLVQDLIEHSLTKSNSLDGINWNLINMLNGKYVVTSNAMTHSFLKLVSAENTTKEFLFENENVLPKAWFVNEIKTFASDKDVIKYMNDTTFTPSDEALIVNNTSLKKSYSANENISVKSSSPNEMVLNVNNKDEGFLVLSEVYYPKGWIAKADEKELDIYKVNHILRGVVVPAGTKEVKFVFEPSTYSMSKSLVWFGNITILLLILIPLFLEKFGKKAKI